MEQGENIFLDDVLCIEDADGLFARRNFFGHHDGTAGNLSLNVEPKLGWNSEALHHLQAIVEQRGQFHRTRLGEGTFPDLLALMEDAETARNLAAQAVKEFFDCLIGAPDTT